MGGLVWRTATGLKSRSGWFPIITCTIGVVANAISECVGSQILQTVPALATMGGEGLGLGAITMELGANTLSALFMVTVGILWKLAPRFGSTFRHGDHAAFRGWHRR
jgi:hypothetical protein